MENKTVTMAHGAGGKQTSELIDQVFKAHFVNNDLTADDAAVLVPPAGRMAVSTDGFIVSPAFFPGGNIGKLSICGTVNDLACMGAKPLYLTCAFVIEEGFPMEKLEEIAAAMEKQQKRPEYILYREIQRLPEKDRWMEFYHHDRNGGDRRRSDRRWRTGKARRCNHRNRRYRTARMHDPVRAGRFWHRCGCDQ